MRFRRTSGVKFAVCGVLGPAAVWTQDLGVIREKSSTDERDLTSRADEAFAVPVPLLKGDELGSPEGCNRLEAAAAFL